MLFGRRADSAWERRTRELAADDLDRPESHGIARSVFARQVADWIGAQAAVLADPKAVRQLGSSGVNVELHDRHGGDGRQVVRVEHTQEGGRQLGEIVIKLVLDSTGQQGECFDQTLDVRIGAAIPFQTQPAGGGGVLLGKLIRELADECQLAL